MRFYRWALGDARREFQSGFPLLGRIQGSAALGFRTILESFPERQRWPLLRARVRRAHQRAMDLCEERTSGAEQNLLRRYALKFADVASHYSQMYQIEQAKAGPSSHFDKKALAALTFEKLAPICGKRAVRYSGYHWWHSRPCARWTIYTEIEIRHSSSSYQLRYHHDIAAPDDELQRICGNISFLLWLGIFPTEWNLIKRGDEENVAASLYGLCAHFMQAAPALLEGLSP